MFQNTIDLIKRLTTEDKLTYRVMDICRFGYLVKNNLDNLMIIRDKEWIKEHFNQVENFIYMINDEPLLYITDIPYKEKDKTKLTDAYYLGSKLVNIYITYDILDKNPSLRQYSSATVSLNGKSIAGTVKDIRVNIEDSYYNDQPQYSNCCITLEYIGYIDKSYYSHALTSERGKIIKNADGSLAFVKQKTEIFRKYRSGCGKAEHYHIPGSDYKKYVEVKAVLPLDIGSEITVFYNVADDPEFIRRKNIDSCNKMLNITTKTISFMDCDGHSNETISDINVCLAKNHDSDFCIMINYIPDEYKHHSKALEYLNYMSLANFCIMLEERYNVSKDTLRAVIVAAQEVCNMAKQFDFGIRDEDISYIHNMIVNLN